MNTTLTLLNLQGNEIKEDGLIAITRALQDNTALEEINLTNNELNCSVGKALGDMLIRNKTLKCLYIGKNDFECEGIIAIANSLTNNTTLEALYLYDTLLMTYKENYELCLKSMKAFLSVHPALRVIDLSNFGLNESAIRELANVLVRIKYLNLSRNELDATCMIPLAAALAQNTTLETLKLRGNRLGLEGAAIIVEALASHPVIKLLDLGNNELGNDLFAIESDEATFNLLQKFIMQLQKNISLETLYLCGNEIGDKAGIFFSDLIKYSVFLKNINLAGNKFSEICGHNFVAALRNNQSLHQLDLSYNEFNVACFLDLMKVSAQHPSLRQINLEKSLETTGFISVDESTVLKELVINPLLKEIGMPYEFRMFMAAHQDVLSADNNSDSDSSLNVAEDKKSQLDKQLCESYLQKFSSSCNVVASYNCDSSWQVFAYMDPIEQVITNNQYFYNQLVLAATEGNIEKIQALLKKGVNPQPSSIYVRFLPSPFQLNHSPNSHDYSAITAAPLHVAAQKGHVTIVELLLAAGADTTVHNAQGCLAITLAIESKHQTIVNQIEMHQQQLRQQQQLCHKVASIIAEPVFLQRKQILAVEEMQQQIKMLIQEAEKQQADFEKRLKEIEAKNQQDRSVQNEISEIKSRLSQLTSQHDELWEKHEEKEFKKTMLKHLQQQSDPHLWIFYSTVTLKLEEIFIGIKTVASHLATPTAGTLGKVGTGIKLLGIGISAISQLTPIPYVSVISSVTSGVDSVLKVVDGIRVTNTAETISEVLNVHKTFETDSDETAWRLMKMYEAQIVDLQTLGETQAMHEEDSRPIRYVRNTKNWLKQKIANSREKEAVKQLAELAVLRIFEALQAGKIDSKKPLPAQFIMAVKADRSTLEWMKDKALEIARMSTVITRGLHGKKERWLLQEIYTEPGLKMALDQTAHYFFPFNKSPEKYGFRWMEENEEIPKDVQPFIFNTALRDKGSAGFIALGVDSATYCSLFLKRWQDKHLQKAIVADIEVALYEHRPKNLLKLLTKALTNLPTWDRKRFLLEKTVIQLDMQYQKYHALYKKILVETIMRIQNDLHLGMEIIPIEDLKRQLDDAKTEAIIKKDTQRVGAIKSRQILLKRAEKTFDEKKKELSLALADKHICLIFIEYYLGGEWLGFNVMRWIAETEKQSLYLWKKHPTFGFVLCPSTAPVVFDKKKSSIHLLVTEDQHFQGLASSTPSIKEQATFQKKGKNILLSDETTSKQVNFFDRVATTVIHKGGGMKSSEFEKAHQELLAENQKLVRQVVNLKRKVKQLEKITHMSSSSSKNTFHGHKENKNNFVEKIVLWEKITVRESEEMTVNNEELLKREAMHFGFECQNVGKDGNCFFHAVADQLMRYLSVQYSVQCLREIAATHIVEHIEEYEEFIGSDPNTYCSKILEDRTWADHLIVQALGRVLNVTITVINSDGTKPIIFRRAKPTATLYLGYEVGNHYQSLIKNKEFVHTVKGNIAEEIQKAEIDTFSTQINFEEPLKQFGLFSSSPVINDGSNVTEDEFGQAGADEQKITALKYST
jgi:hypothetical protein